MQMLNLLKIKR